MRFMLKFAFATDSGNEGLRSGTLENLMQRIGEELKPEASYFYIENGQRTGHFIINMEDSSQIPSKVEPLFFGIKAKVALIPVMNGEDLHKGMAAIPGVIERYS